MYFYFFYSFAFVIGIGGFLLLCSLPVDGQVPGLAQWSKPGFQVTGGYAAYNFYYQSKTDTPYAESNVYQHMINGRLNFALGHVFPFVADAWIRRSNSIYYSNITDVQVSFDAAMFQSQMESDVRTRLMEMEKGLQDSTSAKAWLSKKAQLANLKSLLSEQKLVEANENLRIPEKSYDPSLPDSVNKRRADSVQRQARVFIEEYNRNRELYTRLSAEEDSLGRVVRAMEVRRQSVQSLLSKSSGGGGSESLSDQLRAAGIDEKALPSGYRTMMGIRTFSVGKTPVDYTELTARNISVTGINVEYSSRYYWAFCAGLLDYRFNDVLTSRVHTAPQYLSMIRFGRGRVVGSHVIFSIYEGRKQQYGALDSGAGNPVIPVLGVSMEGRWQLGSNTYSTVEVAQSMSSNLQVSPEGHSSFDLKSKDNKGFSARVASVMPSTRTRLEALYRYTGSNFQSFAGWQTNAQLKTWYIKAEQPLFGLKLKVTASITTNDFVNPNVIQNYQSNMVFKTVSASFKSAGLPSVTIGYMPMSQLTMVGSQVVENRFETLTMNASQYYKLGTIRALSLLSASKFFNGSSDSTYVYYKATNFLFDQSFYFQEFSAVLEFSRSVSSRYALNVAGEQVSFVLFKRGTVGLGCKLNNYNRTENRVGESVNVGYRIGGDNLSVRFERTYLPAAGGGLRLNDIGNVQYVKRFK